MNLSDVLKSLRIERSVTQNQIAIAIGVSTTQYQNYEYGKSEPTAPVIAALAEFFDVPVDYLIGRGVYANPEAVLRNLGTIVNAMRNKIEKIAPGSLLLFENPITSDLNKLRLLDALVESIEIVEHEGMNKLINIKYRRD